MDLRTVFRFLSCVGLPLLGVLLCASVSMAQKSRIPAAQLPSEIHTYLSTHFPEHPVQRVVLDREGLEVRFMVYLEEGFEVEFNRRREVKEIKGVLPLPLTVLSEPIREWLEANHPGVPVREWERERRYQEVELFDGTEIKFDLRGNFLRYGD